MESSNNPSPLNFFNKHKKPDIYLSNDIIPFKERHPIFKTLMKLEFEEVLITFQLKKSKKYLKKPYNSVDY